MWPQEHEGLGAPLRAGDRIGDRYLIEGELASGAMGVIFTATHLVLGRRVAIKVLRPEVSAAPGAVPRFLREARAAVQLEGAHVCQVFDAATLESGAPYIVMELLDGHDLAAELTKRGRLPIREAAAHVLEACEAIAEAHFRDIVHRDLKPSNLFLSRRVNGSSLVKVLDFGISKLRDSGLAGDAALTASSNFLGSPLYMSPEQAQNARDADGRSDIWSIGVILYELVTGTSPFWDQTIVAVLMRIASEAPPPMRKFIPDTPADFERLVLRCLERDRNKRFQTVAELARELQHFAPEHAQLVQRIAGFGSTATLAVTEPASSAHSTERGASTFASTLERDLPRPARPRSRRWLAVASGTAALVFAIALLWRVKMVSSNAASEAPVDPARSAALAPPSVTATTTASLATALAPSEPAVPPITTQVASAPSASQVALAPSASRNAQPATGRVPRSTPSEAPRAARATSTSEKVSLPIGTTKVPPAPTPAPARGIDAPELQTR